MNATEEPVWYTTLTSVGVKAIVGGVTAYLASKNVTLDASTVAEVVAAATTAIVGLELAAYRWARSKVSSTAKLSRVSAEVLGEPEHHQLMAAMSVKAKP